MEEENKEAQNNINDDICKQTENIIVDILEEGIKRENVDFLYKIVDIHKDIANEKYWKIKEECMMYGNYNDGSYGRRGVRGTGRGRYNEGSYGRRGVPGSGRGRYRGEAMLEEMMEEYGNYTEGRDMYGADQDTLKSFKYMLKSFKDYYKHLKEEASSQEEIQLLEQTAREMLEM